MRQFLKRLFCSPVFIVSFAFALRAILLYAGWHYSKNPIRHDLPYGYELGKVARSIAMGKGFSSPLRIHESGPTIWFTPIYPYMVAGVFKIWGIYSFLSEIIIQLSNCAFAALTIIPIHGITKRVFGNNAAIGAAWTWSVFPAALFFPIVWIWDTTLIALFFSLIVWATLVMREKRGTLAWVGYGALWATGGLINPSIFSLFPFFFAWLVWEAWKESVPWAKQLSAALLVFAICLVPWTIRNHRVFGKYVVLRSNFGLELWLGNNPAVADTWTPWLHPNDNPEEGAGYTRMGELAYMADKQHEAFAHMRAHPGDVIYFSFHRFVDNWLAVSDSPKEFWSYAAFWGRAFLVMNILYSLFSFFGARHLLRTRQPAGIPLALILIVFPLIFYISHSSLRYRFPIDPIMMVLASGAMAHLISLARDLKLRRAKMVAPVSSLPTT